MKSLQSRSAASESLETWNAEVLTRTVAEPDRSVPTDHGSDHQRAPASSWSLIIGARKSVFGMASTRFHADQIIHRLKLAGFPSHDLSALFPDNEITFDFGHEKSTPQPRREPPGVLAQTAWWAARRVGFSAIGALVIPGIGSFIAVGPMIAALSGAAVSAAAGGLAGGLIGTGISEFEAKRYESKIKEGRILISVHTEKPEEMARAKEILLENGAQDICIAGDDRGILNGTMQLE
jgi:hypothetical protein